MQLFTFVHIRRPFVVYCFFCVLCGLAASCPDAYSQAPGGVSTPAFWIKADVGFAGSTWADQSGNGITMSLITGSASTTILQNYNPMVTSSGYTTLGNSTTQVGTGNDVSAFFVGLSTNTAAAFAICPLPFDVTTYSKGPVRFNRRHFVSYENLQTNYPEGPNSVFPAPVKAMVSTRNTAGTYYNNATPLAFTPANTNDASYPFCEMPDGSLMGEGIIFNRILTANEIQHVHSYLAIKYGATLTQNYLQVNDTIVYDVSTYPNDIIGIAQDAGAGLLQKQSHTADDSLKIYIQTTLFGSNALNTNTFPAGGGSPNKYVLIGHNGGAQNGKAFSTEYPASYTEGPLSIFNRVSREWKVTNTRYNGPYSLQIQLDAAAAPISAADLRLMIDSDDGNFTNATVVSPLDANAPTITVAGTLVTISNIRTTLIGPNTTRYIALASMSSSTPLPVTLLRFEAVRQAATGQVNLHWTTTQEKNNSHFVVERSSDARVFEPIATMAGKGTLTVVSSYALTDAAPLPGTAYYRLKQVDYNGSYTYSDIQTVSLATKNNLLTVYPNPVSTRLYLNRGQQADARQIPLILYNATGLQLETFWLTDTQDFIDMETYPQGMYYLKMGSTSVRFIKR